MADRASRSSKLARRRLLARRSEVEWHLPRALRQSSAGWLHSFAQATSAKEPIVLAALLHEAVENQDIELDEIARCFVTDVARL